MDGAAHYIGVYASRPYRAACTKRQETLLARAERALGRFLLIFARFGMRMTTTSPHWRKPWGGTFAKFLKGSSYFEHTRKQKFPRRLHSWHTDLPSF